MRALSIIFAVSLAVAAVPACQDVHVSRSKAIDASLYSYEKTIRWQVPRDGYAFMRSDLQPSYVPAWLDSIRIVGYDVLDPPREVEKDKVVQRVRIQYVNQETQVIHTLVDEQQWQTADGGKTWQRTNPIPSYQ